MATCKAIRGFNQFFLSFLADKFCLEPNPNICLRTGAHPIPFFFRVVQVEFWSHSPCAQGKRQLAFSTAPYLCSGDNF